MTNSQDIVAALKNPAIVMSSDDIKVCWDLLKARHSNLQTLQAQSFRVGDRVEFDARGSTKKGVVRKINRKTITVDVTQKALFDTDSVRERVVQWKVAPSLLRASGA